MKLTVFQKILWVMAGVATAAFAYLMLWSEYRPARIEEGSVPFEARFELTDHSGVVRTQNDFAGKWMLVFFGFTNCPDVCPTTLSEVAAVQEGLGDQSNQVQPIFISIGTT